MADAPRRRSLLATDLVGALLPKDFPEGDMTRGGSFLEQVRVLAGAA